MKGWWVKMEIDDFTGHFVDKSDEEIVKDVRASVVDFIRRNPEGDTFGAKMVRKMDDRIASRSEQNSRNGTKGAAARWGKSHGGEPAAGECVDERKAFSSPSMVKLPKTKQEVIEFAIDNGLDPDDASTWAEQNLRERRGRDKDGNLIMNWKGALTNYCKAMEKKRSA